ncbi:hypothetical protein F5B22DRAFT_204966 [Xylaria bambusicola]|uniref:uncharacterized protein n=1 Tax=Xylaria bambusicola TaxID=326684 RepID=UPI002007F129|nr:uncharacterized protein F5B22DRAFT_204966 [Xylaria bambusicola]KAI0515161.1 hypothetical protein F5B22DRAFT_204966 [Xylaria bambusicola]
MIHVMLDVCSPHLHHFSSSLVYATRAACGLQKFLCMKDSSPTARFARADSREHPCPCDPVFWLIGATQASRLHYLLSSTTHCTMAKWYISTFRSASRSTLYQPMYKSACVDIGYEVEYNCQHFRFVVLRWCPRYERTYKPCPPNVTHLEVRNNELCCMWLSTYLKNKTNSFLLSHYLDSIVSGPEI